MDTNWKSNVGQWLKHLKTKKWVLYMLLLLPACFIAEIEVTCTMGYYTKIGVFTSLGKITQQGAIALVSFLVIRYLFREVSVKGYIELWLLLVALGFYGLINIIILIDPYTYDMNYYVESVKTFGDIPKFNIRWIIMLCGLPMAYLFVISANAVWNILRREGFGKSSIFLSFLRHMVLGKGFAKKSFWNWILFGSVSYFILTIIIVVLLFIQNMHTSYIGIGFLMFFNFVFIFVLGAIFFRKNGEMGAVDELQKEIKKMAQGHYLTEHHLSSKSILYDTEENLMHLGNSLQLAVEKAISSEKMKVELLTNVSHDLKTPLTSIIGYGELLAQQEMSPEARELLKKLNDKSAYLREMLQNVLELSKASSGNLATEFSTINLEKILEQTLGELDDEIESFGFVIKRSYPETAVMIDSDVEKLHRVLQNLIDNALKYSLQGSRIYIKLETEKEKARISIVNTAAYEMNFDVQHITDRFVRGDESRTGEGSGLGLAIALSFTELCGGKFEIQTEGDQFKAILIFDRKDQ